MKKLYILLAINLLMISCEKIPFVKVDKTADLKKVDEVLFPYLLTSYMWHVPHLSTDEMVPSSFEWVRFRSAIGEKFSDATDYCLGVKEQNQKVELLFIKIQDGQTCASESNQVLWTIADLKRIIWQWPNEQKKQLQLDFEWIEAGEWKKINFSYDLPYYPMNHESISWGKTWRNQKPFKELDWVNPVSSIFLPLEKNSLMHKVSLTKIPHTDSANWQNSQVCFAVDDQCQPIMAERCHLCERGQFTLYNTKCKTHGTSYCGEIKCGQRNQPACYLGQHHIKQEDFKGCSAFTEEWFCHQGLEIKCSKEGPICY